MISRRKLLGGGVAGMTASLLAACGEPELVELPPEIAEKIAPPTPAPGATGVPPTPPPPPAPIVASSEPVKPQGPATITVGVASGNQFLAPTESLIHAAVADAKEADEDLDLDVIQVSMGGDLADFSARFVNSVESILGDGRTLDVLALPGRDQMITLAEQEIIVDVERFLAGSERETQPLHPLALEATTFEGKRWANPWGITPYVLWFSPEMFVTAGVEPPPPAGWNWEELREAAIRLTVPPDADGSGGQWGFYGGGGTSIFLIWQNAGRVISEDGTRSLLGEPEAVGAMRFLSELAHEYRVIATTVTTGTEVAGEGQLRILVDGSPLAMVLGQGALPGGLGLDALGVKLAPIMHGRDSATLGQVNGMLAVMAGAQDPGTAFYAAELIETKIAQRSPFPARVTSVEDIMELPLGLTEYEAGAVANGLSVARGIVHPKAEEAFGILIREVESPIVTENADPEIACFDGAAAIDEVLLAE